MLEYGEIGHFLPHRHPMLLVDRVLSYVAGESIATVKAISGAEPCYAGVPADAPPEAFGYPETLLVESYAQSGALLWLMTAHDRGERLGGVGMVAVLRECAFERRVWPGDLVRHEIRLERMIGDNVVFSGEMSTPAGRVATVDSIIAAFRPGDTLAASENVSETMSPSSDDVVPQSLR
jgi:3-hydroxyacyl-[acyl-carrier-protein] dehydratase